MEKTEVTDLVMLYGRFPISQGCDCDLCYDGRISYTRYNKLGMGGGHIGRGGASFYYTDIFTFSKTTRERKKNKAPTVPNFPEVKAIKC